ncbi:MAG: hypothetical protein F6J97_14915 [Leptolyngbya sp. SIO4C1]|nr:hypothetical protein [Leptolyngbya sp. SIO4C1]
MKHPVWYTSAPLLLALLATSSIARASDVDEQAISQQPAAADLGGNLVVRPRFGVDFVTDGGGFESFSQFESFLPLWQNPGSDLLFFQGQLSLDLDANLGTSLQLGYRHLAPGSQRIFGGYVAFDRRGTEAASFNQLGLGLETLGEDWDLRLNGYLPIGDRRDLVEDERVSTGAQVSGLTFVGHQLIANAQQAQAAVRRYEAALGGAELELGTKLVSIGEAGALRGYGGLYYYDGPGVDGSLGWRLRLQAEPTAYLRTGLSVQNDSIFGTNVRFNIGAHFPSQRATSAAGSAAPQLARLGESIGRTGQIVVDRQTAVEVTVLPDVVSGPVVNPETGEPWFFNHVAPGATGDGTFETPYGAIALAAETVPTDGNGIIYVAASDGAEFAGFTLPGSVQLLSTGPEQLIAAFDPAVSIQLPFSGSGDFPLIGGQVAIESSPLAPTVLAGFNIQTANSAAASVLADSSLGDVTIRDSAITASETGLSIASDGSAAAGTVRIDNNTIAASAVGAAFAATGSQMNGDLAFSRNRINLSDANSDSATGTAVAISIDQAELTGNIVIADNLIGNGDIVVERAETTQTGSIIISNNESTGSGIVLSSVDSSLTGDILIRENVLERSDSYGIGIESENSRIDGDVIISGNVVDAVDFGIAVGHSDSELAGELTVSDNVIGAETVPYVGILNLNAGSGLEQVTISGNTVAAELVGIGVVNYYAGTDITGSVTITDNEKIQVSGGGGDPLGLGATGVLVFNNADSAIGGGVEVSNNAQIQVAAGDSTAVGVAVLNQNSQIDSGVAISDNGVIEVDGTNTAAAPSDPSDFGTAGIAVVNAADDDALASSLNGGITISGNTQIESSEYGTVVVNSDFSYVNGPDAEIAGSVTVTSNGVISVDDGVLVVNFDAIAGSVIVSGNSISSDEDDGIDFSNLTPDSLVDGDLTLTGNAIAADGDEVKCTNNGTITGTVSSPQPCQRTFP